MNEGNLTPPPHLKGDKLAQWWRTEGDASMDGIPVLNDMERICSYCGVINPCTGNSTCIQCEHSLEDADRTLESTQHTEGSQGW